MPFSPPSSQLLLVTFELDQPTSLLEKWLLQHNVLRSLLGAWEEGKEGLGRTAGEENLPVLE